MTTSASSSHLDRRRLRVVGLALLAGLACTATLFGVAALAGEGPGQLAFVLALLLAGVARGVSAPDAAGLSAGLIWCVQPVALIVGAVGSGELASPSSSTGGLAGLIIGLLFLVLLLPVAGLGAWLGKLLAERRMGDHADSAG